MLGNLVKYGLLLTFLLTWNAGWVAAQHYDPCTGDFSAGQRAVSKIRPSSSSVLKVKPQSGLSARFGGLSGFNPISWGADCCLPAAAAKQFVLAPEVWFVRLSGEARKDSQLTFGNASMVDLTEDLNLPRHGNPMWSIKAHYQFAPKWGVHYSFTPMTMEATGVLDRSFDFAGQSFTAGSTVRTKWERSVHTAGLVFNLSRTRNSMASVFGEWRYYQDKLTIASWPAVGTPVVWDDDKNVMALGVQFQKCLKNYKGNTLALGCKGSVVFLDDHWGYDAEAALNYMIPIKRGRFGFVKGGYRYAHLEKDLDRESFSTTMDGAFVEVGFLF